MTLDEEIRVATPWSKTAAQYTEGNKYIQAAYHQGATNTPLTRFKWERRYSGLKVFFTLGFYHGSNVNFLDAPKYLQIIQT